MASRKKHKPPLAATNDFGAFDKVTRSTIWEARPVGGDPDRIWEPIIAHTWFAARAEAVVIFGCEPEQLELRRDGTEDWR